MSDKVEYEPVPHDDLQDHQKFFINKEKDTPPEVGGVAAEMIGIPTIAGAKTIGSALKSNLGKAILNKIGEVSASPKAPIPTTVGEFHAPEMISEHGFGPGAMKNVAHNVDMARVNQLQADLAANPEKGFGFEGNRRILTPQAKPWEMSQPATTGVPVPSAPPVSLTPAQRALQVVQGVAKSPIVNTVAKGAGTLGSLWEGGENAMRLWNHFKHGQTGREFLDAASLLSNAATVAPTPASPWSNIAGALGSTGTHYLQKYLEDQEAQNKATGGLTTLD